MRGLTMRTEASSGSGPLSIFSAASELIEKRNDADASEAETETTDAPEGGAAGPEPDEAGVTGDHETETEPGHEEVRVIDPPASWPKDQIDEWHDLPALAQQRILKREAEIHSAISEKGREAAEARSAASREKEKYLAKAKQLDNLFPALIERLKSKWEGTDWIKLSTDDPEKYIQLQAEANRDREMLQNAAAAKSAREQSYVEEQLNTLIERNPQYKDGELLQKEAGQVGKFLTSMGYTMEQIVMISAHEFETARDAMRYREASKSASVPAKSPAPKALKPGARTQQVPAKQKAVAERMLKLEAVRKSGGGLNAQLAAAAAALTEARRK